MSLSVWAFGRASSVANFLSRCLSVPCSTSRGVGKDRLGQELQIATGSLCAIMLDPCTPQEKPVLALAEVISLFESKTSGPHPCIPATKSLEKLSFIHVQIYGQVSSLFSSLPHLLGAR